MSQINITELFEVALCIAEEMEGLGLPPPQLSATDELEVDVSYEEEGIFATLESSGKFRLRIRPLQPCFKPEDVRIITYYLQGSMEEQATTCASALKRALERQAQQ